MLLHNILHTHEFVSALVLVGEDREPAEDGPHAIFLSDVEAAGPKRLFPAHLDPPRIQQVPEELPPSRRLKALQPQLLSHEVQRTRSWHGAGSTGDAAGKEGNAFVVGDDKG
mmetsp:Transcript_3304/g.2259  ORF Transcript_3304/g.2259 Transcript_3304/m.2259 type:complete len:112 (-) Transcript_3304:172-507(-)